MSTQIGRAQTTGIKVGAFTLTDAAAGGVTLTGTSTYDHRSLRVVHNATVSNIKNKQGETCALVATDEHLECSFTFIPYGTSLANAEGALDAPSALAGVELSGMDAFAMGPFTDALNTAGDGSQPWIYQGGWEVSGTGDGEPWSISLTLMRYPLITSGAAMV